VRHIANNTEQFAHIKFMNPHNGVDVALFMVFKIRYFDFKPEGGTVIFTGKVADP